MQYTYDANSRLAQVTQSKNGQSTTSTYSYDSRGTRISVESGNQRTTYLADYQNPTGYSQTLVETSTDLATGQITKQIAYAIGFDQISQTTTTYNADGSVATVTTDVLHTDAHGSTRALTNLAGQLIEAYAYQAYGELLEIFNASNAVLHSATLTSLGSGSAGSESIASSARTSYLYAGEAWDVGASAYYNRARFYQPGSGRFLGLDPYAGNQNNPQSFHKYGYTHGDPVNGIDPSGWASEPSSGPRGTSAHQLFFRYVQAVRPHVTPDQTIATLFPGENFGNEGNARPDVVDKVSKEWFDLKPISHKTTPAKQLADYYGTVQTYGFEVYDILLRRPAINVLRGTSTGLVPSIAGGLFIGFIDDGDDSFEVRLYPETRSTLEQSGLPGKGLVYYDLRTVEKDDSRLRQNNGLFISSAVVLTFAASAYAYANFVVPLQGATAATYFSSIASPAAATTLVASATTSQIAIATSQATLTSTVTQVAI